MHTLRIHTKHAHTLRHTENALSTHTHEALTLSTTRTRQHSMLAAHEANAARTVHTAPSTGCCTTTNRYNILNFPDAHFFVYLRRLGDEDQDSRVIPPNDTRVPGVIPAVVGGAAVLYPCVLLRAERTSSVDSHVIKARARARAHTHAHPVRVETVRGACLSGLVTDGKAGVGITPATRLLWCVCVCLRVCVHDCLRRYILAGVVTVVWLPRDAENVLR